MLYAKDLLPFLKAGGQKPELRKLLRTPLYVPESMSVDDLLHKIQGRKVHLAIVLDEYGGTAGMVTIEDLLEEIVGEIQDEYDTEEPMTVMLSDSEARVDGRASVDDLGELLDLDLADLEDADEYDTVGGLIYHRVGGVPRPGDRVELAGPQPDTHRGGHGRTSRRQGAGGPQRAATSRPTAETAPAVAGGRTAVDRARALQAMASGLMTPTMISRIDSSASASAMPAPRARRALRRGSGGPGRG